MSNKPNDGGQAFPGEQGTCPDGTWNQTWEPGMSLRDWFAGMAITAFLSSGEMQNQLAIAVADGCTEKPEEDRRKITREILANRVYRLADAMLAARNKETNPE